MRRSGRAFMPRTASCRCPKTAAAASRRTTNVAQRGSRPELPACFTPVAPALSCAPGTTPSRGGVLNLDAALPEDRAQTIRVFEALLTPRLATQREEDIDKRRHVRADIVAPAAAYEVAEADDQVAHLGPHPVALIGADQIRRPLVEDVLGLEDSRDDSVDIASI